jgi:hypothetical protein
MVSATPRPLYPQEFDTVPISHEAGCDPGPVWTGTENLGPTGIRYPDRPALKESTANFQFLSAHGAATYPALRTGRRAVSTERLPEASRHIQAKCIQNTQRATEV